MCVPGLGNIMGGLGLISGVQQQKVNNKALSSLIQQSTQGFKDYLGEVDIAQREIAQNRDLAQMQEARQFQRERAKVSMLAGESGFMGNSLVRQLAVSGVEQDLNEAINATNLSRERFNLERSITAKRLEISANIYNAAQSMKQSTTNTVLGLVSSGLSGYKLGMDLERTFTRRREG